MPSSVDERLAKEPLRMGAESQPERLMAAVRAAPREWVPHMLRKRRAFPLIFACWAWIAALEVLNFNVTHHQGIPATNANIVRAIRYVPTVGIVVISFFFKALVGDLKKVVPWARMSSKWTTARDSLLLDYVNDIELFSLFVALRLRHWSIILGLAAAFLFGTLVALANSLVYTNLFAVVTTATTITQRTLFQPEGAFVFPNGSLTTQFNVNGTKPYAIVSTLRLPNGYPAPWTSASYAFESFNISAPVANSTLTASVQALSSNLDCKPLRWTWDRPATGVSQIIANSDDVAAAGCTVPIRQEFDSSVMVHSHLRPRGWLNLTTCRTNPSDVRILATMSMTLNMTAMEITNASAFGVICTPRFQTQLARVSAVVPSGVVRSFQLDNSTIKDVDAKTITEAFWVYLNDPLSAQLTAGFTRNATEAARRRPFANMSDILAAVKWNQPRYGVDSFFTLMTEGHIELEAQYYRSNPSSLASDVRVLGNSILVQVMSSLARKPTTREMTGTQSVSNPRLFLRQIPLRVLQGVLFIIGLTGLFHVTIMRPKTVLREDPGCIASSAVLLASSDEQTEHVLARHATENEHDIHHALASTKCMLTYHPEDDRLSLQVTDTANHDFKRQSAFLSASTSTPKLHHGWTPLPLILSSKILIMVGFCVVMGVLAVLQYQSSALGGLVKDEGLAPLVLTFGTTSLLVLLGYTASGVDGSVREMAPFRSLYHAAPRTPLLSNPRDLPVLWIPFQASARQSGFAMLASSSVILAFPVVKIVAAGLYNAQIWDFSQPITTTVDSSLTQYLESTYNDFSPDTVRQRASQFSEWTQVPTLNVPLRAGILDNLVFSNITIDEKSLGGKVALNSEISVKVPAIRVDVNCTVLAPADFSVEASTAADGSINLSLICATRKCTTMLGTPKYLFLTNGVPGQYLGSSSLLDTQAGLGSLDVFYSAAPYLITLADFTAVRTPIGSNTRLNANGTVVTPGMLNVSLPNARAASCTRILSEVEVLTTYTQMTVTGLNGDVRTLPWSPSTYDAKSIEYRRSYNQSMPEFFAPASVLKSGGSAERDGYLANDQLYPNRASSRNFFEMLADRANFQDHNVSGLLDPEMLGRTAQIMYTKYCTEVLTELRPFAVNRSMSDTDAIKPVVSILISPQSRMFMSLPGTIVLESLLLLSMLCLLWVFLRYPHRPIVPKPPQTLASRLSFLANSSLVKRLRNEKVTNRHKTTIWHEICSLGWWDQRDASGHHYGWRWGIDLGRADEKNWDKPPVGIASSVLYYHGSNSSEFHDHDLDHEHDHDYDDHDDMGARAGGIGMGHQRSRSDIELSMLSPLSPPHYDSRFHEDVSLLKNAG